MNFLPPLPTMLSSASADVAKVWLDLKGWPAATELLRRHNLLPTTGWGKKASALVLLIAGGFVDWYKSEDTPVARFTKDVLRDVPSELIGQIWKQTTSSPTSCAPAGCALLSLEPAELKQIMGLTRGLTHIDQLRMRFIVSQATLADLKNLAHTDAADLTQLLGFLAPRVSPDGPSLGNRLNARLEGLANFLVPGLGR